MYYKMDNFWKPFANPSQPSAQLLVLILLSSEKTWGSLEKWLILRLDTNSQDDLPQQALLTFVGVHCQAGGVGQSVPLLPPLPESRCLPAQGSLTQDPPYRADLISKSDLLCLEF